MKRKKETAYGIIPLKKEGDQWRIFLVRHLKGDYWAFPKGHAEESELPHDVAVRELHEETALTIDRLLDYTFSEKHLFEREGRPIEKDVTYFTALVSGHAHMQTQEISEGAWFSLEEALEKITFSDTKKIVKELKKYLQTE